MVLDAAGYDAMFRDSRSILRWCQLDHCQFDVNRAFVLSHCSLRSVFVLAAHLEHGRTPLSSTVWPGGSVTRTYTVPEAPNQLRHVPTMGLEISQQWEA